MPVTFWVFLVQMKNSINKTSLGAPGCFQHQSGGGNQAEAAHTQTLKTATKPKPGRTFSNWRKTWEIRRSRKKKKEGWKKKRPDVFLTCKYKLSRILKVRSGIHKSRVIFFSPGPLLGWKKPWWCCPDQTGLDMASAEAGTSAQRDRQAGIGAWCWRKKKAIFAQDIATAPGRAWGDAGSTGAGSTESKSLIFSSVLFTHWCFSSV